MWFTCSQSLGPWAPSELPRASLGPLGFRVNLFELLRPTRPELSQRETRPMLRPRPRTCVPTARPPPAKEARQARNESEAVNANSCAEGKKTKSIYIRFGAQFSSPFANGFVLFSKKETRPAWPLGSA